MMQSPLLLFVLACFGLQVNSQGTAVYLNSSNVYNAKCLDGTPPMYWITYGSGSGANKWLLSFEGGGACNGIYPAGGGYNNCYYFAYDYAGGYYGTSDSSHVSPTFDFNANYGNYYSNNATLNPMMHNWNTVYMHYCDGGLWTGSIADPVPLSDYPGEVLSFRGGANAWAIFNDLLDNQGMGAATDVVVSGQSAGGIAAYNYIDLFAAALPAATKVSGLMDSGFFLPLDYPGCDYKSQVDWIFENMGSQDYLNPACLTAQASSPGNCMFAQYMVPVTETPMFGIQSRFDSYQYGYILCNSTDMSLIYDYSVTLADAYFTAGMNSGANGGLLDNCPHHYYYYNFSVPNPQMFDPWNTVVGNNGMSQATGFQAWYNGDTAATNLTQTPVPHGLDFSYCSTAWTAAPTSSGSGKSNRLSSDAVAGIAAAILVFLFLAMAAARVSVLGFQDCRGKGESTLPFTSRDAGVEMN